MSKKIDVFFFKGYRNKSSCKEGRRVSSRPPCLISVSIDDLIDLKCNRYPYFLLSFSSDDVLPAGGKRKEKARRKTSAAIADFSRRKTRVFSLFCACRTLETQKMLLEYLREVREESRREIKCNETLNRKSNNVIIKTSIITETESEVIKNRNTKIIRINTD